MRIFMKITKCLGIGDAGRGFVLFIVMIHSFLGYRAYSMKSDTHLKQESAEIISCTSDDHLFLPCGYRCGVHSLRVNLISCSIDELPKQELLTCTGIDDDDLYGISSIGENIKALHIHNSPSLSFHGLAYLYQMPHLIELSFSGMPFLVTYFSIIERLPDLRTLTLSDVSMSSYEISGLRNFHQLEHLFLHKIERLANEHIQQILNIRYLKTLKVSECPLVSCEAFKYIVNGRHNYPSLEKVFCNDVDILNLKSSCCLLL